MQPEVGVGGGGVARVMGIDPGLAVTGYGVVDTDGSRVVLVEGGAIRVPSTNGMPALLAALFREVLDAVEEFRPDVLVVEELYSAYGHPRTAILMAHARGVILLAAEQAVIPVIGYPATAVKRTLTGNGRASKAQMQRTVAQRLRLRSLPNPVDAADALALAICHSVRYRSWIGSVPS